MSAELASRLIQAMVASSAAALLVIAVRKILRMGVGARAAYWIWLLLPVAAVVVLVPHSNQSAQSLAGSASSPVSAATQAALSVLASVTTVSRFGTVLLALWLAGSLGSWALILRRHRTFVRSLGKLVPTPDGSLRALSCKEPMLLGLWRPLIVLPWDFDRTYGANERAMVLAHEQAHWRRFDPQINALAALWLSLSWFNPLMYLAHRLFRFDQELACDATVLSAAGATRRRYAEALVKIQLSVQLAGHRTVLGCLWHSFHPLTERIHMLKHPLPSELRRRAGLGLMLGCVLGGGYAVRSAQSQVAQHSGDGPPIAINVKAFMNGAQVLSPTGSSTGWDVLVHSGGQFVLYNREHVADCRAQLAKGSGHDILLSCKLSRADTVIARPTMLVRDGETASVNVQDPKEGTAYRLEFNASTAAARIASMSAVPAYASAPGVKAFVLEHNASGAR